MNTADIPEVLPAPANKRRRIKGLSITAVPGLPLLAQVCGGVAALVGAYQQFGLGVTLIAGGLAVTVLGALREGGKI